MRRRNLHLVTPEMAELWAEHQQQEKLDREIHRAYIPERVTPETAAEREKGDVVRAVLELDRLIRRTGLPYTDLLDYPHLPHTFPSTAQRLFVWFYRAMGLPGDSPGPTSPTQSGTVT